MPIPHPRRPKRKLPQVCYYVLPIQIIFGDKYLGEGLMKKKSRKKNKLSLTTPTPPLIYLSSFSYCFFCGGGAGGCLGKKLRNCWLSQLFVLLLFLILLSQGTSYIIDTLMGCNGHCPLSTVHLVKNYCIYTSWF